MTAPYKDCVCPIVNTVNTVAICVCSLDCRLAQRMFRNNMDNSLTISGTMSLDTAAYSCMATNGLDEDEITAQLIVQGQYPARHQPVTRRVPVTSWVPVSNQPGTRP